MPSSHALGMAVATRSLGHATVTKVTMVLIAIIALKDIMALIAKPVHFLMFFLESCGLLTLFQIVWHPAHATGTEFVILLTATVSAMKNGLEVLIVIPVL